MPAYSGQWASDRVRGRRRRCRCASNPESAPCAQCEGHLDSAEFIDEQADEHATQAAERSYERMLDTAGGSL